VGKKSFVGSAIVLMIAGFVVKILGQKGWGFFS
jgi:hypothetical protein